jgi:predicted  nucleic acid-binding Zn-ribbon protein
MTSTIYKKKQCKKCGVEFADKVCKSCRNIASAKYRETHAEEIKARSAMYRKLNKDKVQAFSAAWRKENPEKTRAGKAAWRRDNKEKISASKRLWRLKNKEKVIAQKAAWGLENKDRRKATNAAWYQKNKDLTKANKSIWRKSNLEACRIHNHNRRAKQRENGGELSKGIAAKLFKLQKGKCACCGKSLGKDYHLDHRMPIALGGPNIDSNMQLLTRICNLQKHAKDPIDFMQSRGFLC